MSNIYDDLFQRIADAREKLLENRIRANTVIINGRKYGMLGHQIQDALRLGYTPSIVGLSADSTCALPDDFDFIVTDQLRPPQSEFDRLRNENKRLRERLRSIEKLAGFTEKEDNDE